MAKLFGKNKLRNRAQGIRTEEILPFIALVDAWRNDYHTGSLRTDNETAREQAYNQTFFKDILGYSEKPADPYSFQPKASTEQRGIPDAVIGHFETAGNHMNFSAVVELKGAGVNLDRPQRGEGNLSPVQQGFKYKPLYRSVPFVVVSNFWEFRLYNDNQLDYEVWTLDDLVNPDDEYLAFKSWYVLLHHDNFTSAHGQSATEKLLLRKTGDRIIACFDDSGAYPEQSLYFVYDIDEQIHPQYLLAILNSNSTNWLFRNALITNAKSTPQLKNSDLNKFPIPQSSPEAQKQVAQMATRIAGTTLEAWNRAKHFTVLVSSSFGLNGWPSRLTHWWTLDFGQFVKALKAKLTLTQKDELLPVFEKYKAELTELDAEIQRLDREIDRLVYQLYELTPEEIALVEASV